MSMDKTSLSKNNKYKKTVLWWLLCLIGLFILFVCIYFLAWGMMMQPKPNNQPEHSIREKQFFSDLEEKEGRTGADRYIYNVDKEGKSLFQNQIRLDKNYAYMFTIEIEDSSTFYSLPANVEDTIALHLYNYVLEKSPKLQKIVVVFSYEEILNERASMGHGLTAEYEIRGKKLVKLKRVKE